MTQPHSPQHTTGRGQSPLAQAVRNAAASADALPVEAPAERLTVATVCFRLADVWFGVPAEQVQHVVALPDVFPVPTTPAHVLGVADVAGKVTPLIDLRRFLALEQVGRTLPGGSLPDGMLASAEVEIGARRVVVVHADGLTAGFPVDSVREVVDVPLADLQQARVSVNRVREFARGEVQVQDRAIVLLALPALLRAASVPADRVASGEGF